MQFAATDGFTLHGTLYEGGADAILIASALGVKRRYYDAFAHAAVARGFTVFTFDYRGIGESRPSSLRGFNASMHDWGALDLPAAIDQLKGARSITLVGHSAGGQIPGLASNVNAIDRLVRTAQGAGDMVTTRSYARAPLTPASRTLSRRERDNASRAARGSSPSPRGRRWPKAG